MCLLMIHYSRYLTIKELVTVLVDNLFDQFQFSPVHLYFSEFVVQLQYYRFHREKFYFLYTYNIIVNESKTQYNCLTFQAKLVLSVLVLQLIRRYDKYVYT